MNTGSSGRSAATSAPCGTFISSTMIVMMMAMTPSENASSRPFVIPARALSAELDPAAEALGLGHGRLLARRHRVQRVFQVAGLHLVRLLPVVVDGAVVRELAGLVEQERLR